MLSVAVVVASAVSSPIIGGYGDFRFEYDPEKLALPPGTELLNAHGLVIDPTDGSLILTYEPVHQLRSGHAPRDEHPKQTRQLRATKPPRRAILGKGVVAVGEQPLLTRAAEQLLELTKR